MRTRVVRGSNGRLEGGRTRVGADAAEPSVGAGLGAPMVRYTSSF